jgi:hypothetical protein
MAFRLGNIICFIFFGLFIFNGISMADTGMMKGQNPADEELFEGFVYYLNPHKTALKSVRKIFSSSLDSHKLGIEILESLIEGPSDASLWSVWPRDTKINAFFITDDGSAFVDLDVTSSMMENMDTTSELLAIYSMVNSLTLNIPAIKQVKLLIQGKDAQTLAGHIGLEHFYRTNMLIVK